MRILIIKNEGQKHISSFTFPLSFYNVLSNCSKHKHMN